MVALVASFLLVITLRVAAQRFAAASGFFAFALHARLLIMFSAASFSQNTFLLNFAVEPPQGGIKLFVIANSDF